MNSARSESQLSSDPSLSGRDFRCDAAGVVVIGVRLWLRVTHFLVRILTLRENSDPSVVVQARKLRILEQI